MADKLLGCVLYDKIKGKHLCFSFCNSKAEYIRSNVEDAIRIYRNLNDLQPKVVCTYDVDTGIVEPKCEEFSFSEYEMPISKADALAPLGPRFTKDVVEFEEWKKSKAEAESKKE